MGFLRIGSNDFIQYTIAVGRENPLIIEYFTNNHSIMLQLIVIIVNEAGDTTLNRLSILLYVDATGIYR